MTPRRGVVERVLAVRSEFSARREYRAGGVAAADSPALATHTLINLSQNEAPYAPSAVVAATIDATARQLHQYPAPGARLLVEAIARHRDVAPEHVLVGAGSSDLILVAWRLMTGPGKRGIYAWPGFEMYALAGAFAGAVNVPVPLAADGRPDIAGLVEAARHPDARVLAVCNPHNPTGTYLTHREFLELLDGVPDQVLVINDEAYAEFAEAADFPRLTVESTRRPNLVTLRTFSKIYGLAGLRAGYAITSPSVIDLLRRAHTPFAISRPAEAGSVAALHEADEVARRAEMNRRERGRLLIELRRRGFSCLPSQANFVFALPPWQGPWHELLLRRGVLVRPFEAALRITIGLPEHHEVLLAALDEIAVQVQ